MQTLRDAFGNIVTWQSADGSIDDFDVNFDRLFGTFDTTTRNGMGIGLSLCRSIVEKHHGRLWAQLNDGPGATFSVFIPRSPESAGNRRQA